MIAPLALGAALLLLAFQPREDARHLLPPTPSPPESVPLLYTPEEARRAFGPLSRSVSWSTLFERSRGGPIPYHIARRLKVMFSTIADVIAEDVGPFRVSSVYREGDRVASGRPSAHAVGWGWDLVLLPADPNGGLDGAVRIAEALRARGIPWDRIIGYDPERGGHVHIGYRHPTHHSVLEHSVRHAPANRLDFPIYRRWAA